MNTTELKTRIEKKESDIAKINKRIAKWEAAKSDKEFIRRYDWCQRDSGWWNRQSGQYDLSYEDFKANNFEEYCNDCDKEIRYANRDLEDAITTLNKYKNALAIEDEKNRTPKFQIIVDFLNNWKTDAKAYVKMNMKVLLKYYEVDKEECEFSNNRWKYKDTMTQEEIKAKLDSYREEERKLKSMIHPWTQLCYDRHELDKINHDKLQELVDKEAEAKYWDMINRVTEKAGEIIDVTHLTIGGKGDLNGYIQGTKNKVHLETITAGGMNTGIIVNVKRGPIAHYRTIVNVVKGE